MAAVRKKMPKTKAVKEERRISGDLFFCGVKDVEMCVDASYVDGAEQGDY